MRACSFSFLALGKSRVSCTKLWSQGKSMKDKLSCSRKLSFQRVLAVTVERDVASWPYQAGLWCPKLSVVGVRAPATVASQPGSRSRLVNLLLRS